MENFFEDKVDIKLRILGSLLEGIIWSTRLNKGERVISKSFIEQVHYIRIPVKDLERSAKWYRDVLGLQLLNHSEERAILKVNEGPFLLILVPTEDETFAHFTIDHEQEFSIGFTSPELSKFHQHLMDSMQRAFT